MAPSALSQAIANGQWSLATQNDKQYPDQARKSPTAMAFLMDKPTIVS